MGSLKASHRLPKPPVPTYPPPPKDPKEKPKPPMMDPDYDTDEVQRTSIPFISPDEMEEYPQVDQARSSRGLFSACVIRR